jgi:isopentenyl phosphate kinase
VTTVLKLGGSVVTRKGESETADREALAAAADAVAAAVGTAADGPIADPTDPPALVVVHGGGSFGHPAAAARGVGGDDGTRDAAVVAAVHAAMTRLSEAVCGALRDRNVPAVPVRPLSFAVRDGDGGLDVGATAVRSLRAEGFLPVAHGDVVGHAGRGASVSSGDALAVALAAAVDADRIGVCATTPVRDAAGRPVDRIDAYDEVADALGGSDATDVTGGMAAKVRALLAAGRPAAVFAPDELGAFLDGDWPGTRIGG